ALFSRRTSANRLPLRLQLGIGINERRAGRRPRRMVVNGHGRAATVMIVKPSRDRPPRLVALLLAALVPAVAARADSVVMKSGQTFQTIRPPDRDNTLMFLWDGLKKIVVRDSKVDRVIPDGSLRTGEKF